MQIVEQILDSREVAEMVGKGHKELLRDIRRYCGQLGESKIALSDFFTESTYRTAQNKEMPCYNVTKKGCEFIAHKLTGKKGTEFTAKYINRFHEMEEELNKNNHMDWFVNDIRVFQHREFGVLRTLKLDGQDYFVGIDVTRSLGYVNNTDTLKKRVSNPEKCYVGICDGNRCRKMVAITQKGLEELIRTGKLPMSSKYNEWIQKVVIPTLSGTEIVPIQKEEALLETKPVSKPNTRTVVDIPENAQMQKAIQDIRKQLNALDVIMQEYNVYRCEESYTHLKSTLDILWISLGRKIVDLMDVKPNLIQKQY